MDEKRELLDLLQDSARESTADIARQLGMEEAAVETLIAELEDEGVIRGYQAVIDWGTVEGERVTAMVELNVELDRETKYTDISARIAKFPEVSDLKLVSGDYDFAVEVVGDSMHDVSMFVSERIAPIPEVTQTVTHFVMDTYKERGIEFGDHTDDDRLNFSP
ncbi:Lrp/AsnC family transcriptional regulator [Salinigranum rubrum]|uniref:Lrp/AsnC family transcriptional regulator n=1 Tax=Salinigranum rubrum TaxID=755307 RepID=A0A2I8VI50_9EURY|nr:Lrp/AsnC family transcriptional regulator [Salinigranum rubrum]AUV81616.1 Lrp/AsnC family transcriptional regulator [Salinigranum rubrum]